MGSTFEEVVPIETIISSIILFIPKLVLAVVIFLATLYIARLGYRYVLRLAGRRRVGDEVELLLARLTQITIIVFGTIWALAAVDFDVTAFVAGLGIIGFTVGFALKDIAENFVAGILLLLQKPFTIGDAVDAGGFEGTVQEIKIRTTTIHTFDGLPVIIPNAQIYSNPITNFSKVPQRRISLKVGVGYDTDLDQATEIMQQVISSLPGVKDEPAPIVVFEEFGDSSINATLYFWVDMGEAGYFDSLDGVVKRIKTALTQEEIEIPYPTRTLQLAVSEQMKEMAALNGPLKKS